MTEPIPNHETPTQAQIGDSFDALARHKGLLLGMAVAFGLLGVVYTISVKPRYEAKTTILLPGSKAPSSAASLAASLGVAGLGSSGDTTLPMFRKILESETVTAAIARKRGLKKLTLRQMRTIEDDAKTNSIEIGVQSPDKALALGIANDFITQLGQANTKLSIPGKSRKADLLKKTLDHDANALARAEDQLQKFVSTAVTSPGMGAVPSTADTPSSNGSGGATPTVPGGSGVAPVFRYRDRLTSLNLQLEDLDTRLRLIDAKSAEASRLKPDDFPPVAQWKRRLNELEAALNTARATYAPDSPEVREAQRNQDEVQKLMDRDVNQYLTSVERRVTGDVTKLDLDRAGVVKQIAAIRQLADAAPKEALEYQRLARNVGTLTSLVTQLRVQYEQARLESADDPNRWEVLDAPFLGDEPVNKKYARNVSLAALVGFFLGIPFALWRDKRRG